MKADAKKTYCPLENRPLPPDRLRQRRKLALVQSGME